MNKTKSKKYFIFSFIFFTCIALILVGCDKPSEQNESQRVNDIVVIVDSDKPCEHIESKWIIDSVATIDVTGSKHIECLKCGEILEIETIPKIILTKQSIIEKLNPCVFKIYNYDYDGKTLLSQGTGFFIDANGNFITNAHVINNTYYSEIKLSSGFRYEVDKIYEFNYISSDYAICHANIFTRTPCVNFSEELSIGENVYSLGYPNDSFFLQTNSGELLDVNVFDKGKHYLENTAKIDAGSSGGILANVKGEVIGITTGIFENRNFAAVKYTDFKNNLDNLFLFGEKPVDFFHTVTEISLESYNVSTYFDVFVEDYSFSSTSVNYDVTVSLKRLYQDKKIVIKNIYLFVNVALKTDYIYYEYDTYGSYLRTRSTIDYCYFNFYDKADLFGKHSSAYSFITIFGDHSTVYYSYNVDFSGASGTIIIYD